MNTPTVTPTQRDSESNIDKTENKIIYSVVKFIGNPEVEEFSVIPNVWLLNNSQCKWPKSMKSVRKSIIKQIDIEDWITYDVVVMKQFEAYEDAVSFEKKLAELSSQTDSQLEEIKRQRRRKKLKKNLNTECFTPPPCLSSGGDSSEDNSPITAMSYKSSLDSLVKTTSDDNSTVVTPNSSKSLSAQSLVKTANSEKLTFSIGSSGAISSAALITNNIGSSTTTADIHSVCSSSGSLSKGTTNSTESTSSTGFNGTLTSPGQFTDNIDYAIYDSTEMSSAPVLLAGNLEDSPVLKQILKEVITVKLAVSQLMSNITSTNCTNCKKINQNNLLPNLPIDSIEDLETLEKLCIENIEVEGQLMNLLVFIGGADPKNCTKRCLSKIFSNKLGEKCSWTGAKKNHAVKTLKIMTIIKNAAKHNFPDIKESDFEKYTMDWFRHASQRLTRTHARP